MHRVGLRWTLSAGEGSSVEKTKENVLIRRLTELYTHRHRRNDTGHSWDVLNLSISSTVTFPQGSIALPPFIVKHCIAIMGYSGPVYIQLKSKWSAEFIFFYISRCHSRIVQLAPFSTISVSSNPASCYVANCVRIVCVVVSMIGDANIHWKERKENIY